MNQNKGITDTGSRGLTFGLVGVAIFLCNAVLATISIYTVILAFVGYPIVGLPLSCFGMFIALPGIYYSVKAIRNKSSSKGLAWGGAAVNAFTLMGSIALFLVAIGLAWVVSPVKEIENVNTISGAAFSPDGRSIYLWHMSGTNINEYSRIEILDVSSGALKDSFAEGEEPAEYFVFAPNDSSIYGLDSHSFRVWDATTHEKKFSKTFTDYIEGIYFSADGAELVLLMRESGAMAFDTTTHAQKRIVPLGDLSPRQGYTFFGGYLFYADMSAGQGLIYRLSDFAGGDSKIPLATFTLQENVIYKPVVSPDESVFASTIQHVGDAYHSGIQIWDVQEGGVIQEIKLDPPLSHDEERFTNLVFSPDSGALAYPIGDSLILQNLKTYESRRLIGFLPENNGTYWDFTFSPDGKKILFNDSDAGLILWDIESKAKIWEYTTASK